MIPRVPLYGPEPVGVGTALIESLTGFVNRLAIDRYLAPADVFDHLVRPLVSKGVVREKLGLSLFLATGAVVYDGMGGPAEEVVGALTRLSGLENLSYHTFLPWRPLFASRSGALHYGRKRWCASCFAEWRSKGLTFWEPLLWRAAPARRCPAHRVPFSELCPACGAFQGLFQVAAPLGTCRRCGHHLEVGDQRFWNGSETVFENDAARREWWLSVEVGRMLAFQSTVSAFANPAGFRLLLKESISRPGIDSIRGLVRYLGVERGSVLAWLRGNRFPNLESFLLVCMRLGADPLRVAVMPHVELPEGHAGPREEAPFPWPPICRGLSRSFVGPRGPGFWIPVTERLSKMLAGPEAGRYSAVRVAGMLGVSNHTLRKRYPREFARLLVLHDAYRERERARTFAERRDKLRKAVLEIVCEGVYPSQERVFLRAGLSQAFSWPSRIQAGLD